MTQLSHTLASLPLSVLHDEFCAALDSGCLLLEAEPGAGKSTLAPLWALQKAPAGQQVWLIQPRVLPSITLARRLASLWGDKLGETVGYQVPFDRSAGPRTRLWLMTPGILLQRLLTDPELTGVSTVILDEIHERGVNQDLAWALLQEAAILREDLRLVLMSATPDTALRAQVEQRLFTPGRCHPVSVSYVPPEPQHRRDEPLSGHLLRALAGQRDWQTQTVLVFLPGWRAINDCLAALSNAYPHHRVYCLHSRVARSEQLAALDPASGPRLLLATNIAETSLTIADVTLVIDSGLAREAQFSQRTGITRLQTRRIASANAEQRRGRAGRVQAGHCVRLWAQAEALVPQALPEIRRTDYLPLALRAAHWGTPWQQLPWLEVPNPMAMSHAIKQLVQWQLLDTDGAISALGLQVSALGTHPRIAALLLLTQPYLPDNPWLLMVALALHFDWQNEASSTHWLASAASELAVNRHWQQQSKRWQRCLNVKLQPSASITPLGASLAEIVTTVFRDRVGFRQASKRYRLNSGISVELDCQSEWALALQIYPCGQYQQGIGLAVALSEAQLLKLSQVHTELEQTGSGKNRRWVCQYIYRVGGHPVKTSQQTLPAAEVPGALLEMIRQQGLAQQFWPREAVALLWRARIAQQQQLLSLPDLRITALEQNLDDWLLGFLTENTDLAHLPLLQGLRFYLGFAACSQLDRLLPSRITLPSARSVEVVYGPSEAGEDIDRDCVAEARIAGKLQEFFGAAEWQLPATEVTLAIELLSPAGRPLAITRDLAFFWREVYPQVRREVRGRYVKHPWPENPLTHPPTAFTKRRLSQQP